MSNRVFIGRDLSSLDFSPEFQPISKVVAKRSSDTWFEAGDDTGRTLEFTNPWATQEMANSVLSELKGFTYRPYSGQDAIYPITAEIGDAISIGGEYSLLATSEIDYGSLTLADVSAPEDEELDHEYPFKTTEQKEADRENKRIYSLITKTDEEIRLYVADEVNGLESEISQTADSLTAQINSVDGRVTSLSASLDGIEASITGLEGDYSGLSIQLGQIESTVSDVEGSISTVKQTVNGLEITTNDLEDSVDGLGNGTTRISGYCIQTGKIAAEYLEVGDLIASRIGSGYVDLLDSSDRSVGTISIRSSTSAISGQGLNISAPAIGLNAESGDVFLSSRGEATYVHINTDDVTCKGGFRPTGSGTWNLGSSSNKWANVYATNGTIQTSDRNQKTNIVYGLDGYNALFDGLKVCTYLMKDGGKRKHPGLIAQDVEETMQATGVSDMDFAGFIKTDNGDGTYDYALRYSEFIPLLIDQVQKLKARVAGLEDAE